MSQSKKVEKPELATWYPVRGLIEFYHHLLAQIWKNLIAARPRVIGDFLAQDISRFMSKPGDLQQLIGEGDFLVSLNTVSNITKNNLSILQEDMKMKELIEASQNIWDHIMIGAGLPPINEAQVEKTATEIVSKHIVSGEAINLLTKLRIDQWSRVFDEVLIIERLWDGKGERPYTFSFAPEDDPDEQAQIETSLLMIQNFLSNPIKEISNPLEGYWERSPGYVRRKH